MFLGLNLKKCNILNKTFINTYSFYSVNKNKNIFILKIMSLKFALIPINSSFVHVAYDIKSKIKDIVEEVFIDTNYDLSFTNRIQKRKKEDFNIITIDEDYNETKSIVVKYCEKGSRAYSYQVDEFIDLISSYDNDDDDDKNKDTNDINKDENKDENNCVIM